MEHLSYQDPEIYKIVAAEKARIENTLDLIAAENHARPSIMEAQGSAFNMKAAEGYPGRRCLVQSTLTYNPTVAPLQT